MGQGVETAMPPFTLVEPAFSHTKGILMNFFTRRVRPGMLAGMLLCGLPTFVVAQSLAACTPTSSVAGSDRFEFTGDKTKKVERKKFTPPKLPSRFGNPMWDVTALEERFIVVSASVDKKQNQLVFLIDLKEDASGSAPIVAPGISFFDKAGVKYYQASSIFIPNTGKAGDRVRLVVNSHFIPINQETWANAIKLQVIFE